MSLEDDFEKELDSYIEHEEKVKQQKEKKNKEEISHMEKTDKPEKKEVLSDNESEGDDYNLTEDQRRALEELDNLKTELGYPDEEPPEYDVKDKLIKLNAELAEDPTPVEKLKDSKVVFKENLVDLVVPPDEFNDDDETKEPNTSSKASFNASSNATSNTKTESSEKEGEKSEPVSGKKSNSDGKKDRVLIEVDGRFEYVDADDVRAKDLGLIIDNNDEENVKRKENLEPAPPLKPRPSTANNTSRRNIRPTPKPRPQSAQVSVNKGSALNNFNYNSPYALSPREKQMLEERKKALEKQKQQDERRRRDDDEKKNRESREAFEYWLKKKREQDRRTKIGDEEDRKRNEREDKDSYDDEASENEEHFKEWLKEKNQQFKKEKLLKRRQEQEQHDGYYVRSREECDKAYKVWLRHKAVEARKARVAERQKNKMIRLAAKRQRKSNTLARSIKESQSFRYVDYYGYRF